MALFFAYLALELDSEASWELAMTHLGGAVEKVDQEGLGLSLHNGIVGIAWTLRHLDGLYGGEPSAELTEAVDQLLLSSLRVKSWKRELDLTYGLVGLGTYALDHDCRLTRSRLLEGVLHHLEAQAEYGPNGTTWQTRALSAEPAAVEPQQPSSIDLGMAHGIPGVVAFLARTVSQGEGGQAARRLLTGASRWLLGQRRFSRDLSSFSYHAQGTRSARAAWCYGDPGAGGALLAAAEALGDPALELQALEVLRRDLRRPRAAAGVVDAGLCHGASGLGHLYNRIYQATGRPAFGRAARRWLLRTLAMQRPGTGIAGFASFWPADHTWHDQPGLLDGATGIGLALLAATSTAEPCWDRPLLIPGS